MRDFLFYVPAALAEIGGCFSFWAWLKLNKSPLWLFPGAVSLALFAYLLTKTSPDDAGRSFATYGGIYIVMSLVWMGVVEGKKPDHWDILGASICLVGAMIILFSPHNR
ncbi:MAG: YnfA family protein [Zymomonas mobilis subsp. pomaceae]|nr:YnfA family protein [Zymomonas mobilis]MDX5948061.1 YnfA family protein [Zymomonas mobilis subsp. pomaceae]